MAGDADVTLSMEVVMETAKEVMGIPEAMKSESDVQATARLSFKETLMGEKDYQVGEEEGFASNDDVFCEDEEEEDCQRSHCLRWRKRGFVVPRNIYSLRLWNALRAILICLRESKLFGNQSHILRW